MGVGVAVATGVSVGVEIGSGVDIGVAVSAVSVGPGGAPLPSPLQATSSKANAVSSRRGEINLIFSPTPLLPSLLAHQLWPLSGEPLPK